MSLCLLPFYSLDSVANDISGPFVEDSETLVSKLDSSLLSVEGLKKRSLFPCSLPSAKKTKNRLKSDLPAEPLKPQLPALNTCPSEHDVRPVTHDSFLRSKAIGRTVAEMGLEIDFSPFLGEQAPVPKPLKTKSEYKHF